MHEIWPYAAALIPFLGAAFMFYVIMKAVLESDRRERLAQRKWEAEHGDTASKKTRGNSPTGS
ncbi:Lysyl-tRNA synthetase (modular protein) [Nostocoides japonicum T1-X7]|uniref:Lysyl-tRNA synthetase (Modular protein) n=1 Tax=Nostocoides japonicum T1-X7 TaxID=1194083 RepID=A0A077M229_9MICO|nr:hypothetical protein [Tetrasphaera japonica]CCH80408.1 Lysyl-tRNA synthetase (modular protein) [Tetrasphaera japonica T1-X7]